MNSIQYLSQFNLLHNLSLEDLIEMDQMTSITNISKKPLYKLQRPFPRDFIL
jgi:CRP/FNR family transcriptional regulator